jgi:hypothetical protein
MAYSKTVFPLCLEIGKGTTKSFRQESPWFGRGSNPVTRYFHASCTLLCVY